MQRYLSSEQWRKRPNKLEGEVPQEGHSLLCSDCGFFCPEAPATEKRRRKEAAAPPAVGTRGREEPRERTLKRKEEQVLDSKSGAVHSGIVYPCPCPCHFSLGGSLGPQGTEFSHCGALISASRSDGTWDKASPVLPGNGNGNCPAGRRQPLVAMTTSSWASKQIEPTDLACYIPHRWRECCWVTERLWVYPTGLDDEHLGCQERSREVGTGLPPTLTFSSLLFQPFKVYQGEGAASQNILVARRASEWQKVLRTLEKRYIRLKANGRFRSYYVDIFITKRQLMRRWNRRLRKYAWKREEVGKEKISREHRTKQDQRETKTSLHTGTTWGKQKENAVQGMGKEHESYLTHKENF